MTDVGSVVALWLQL